MIVLAWFVSFLVIPAGAEYTFRAWQAAPVTLFAMMGVWAFALRLDAERRTKARAQVAAEEEEAAAEAEGVRHRRPSAY